MRAARKERMRCERKKNKKKERGEERPLVFGKVEGGKKEIVGKGRRRKEDMVFLYRHSLAPYFLVAVCG